MWDKNEERGKRRDEIRGKVSRNILEKEPRKEK